MDSFILNELKSWQDDWIFDTSLYYPEGIHVKYSPRAGSQSLKLLLINILFPDNNLDFIVQKKILQTIKISNFKCSTKIAIKRDPIDRFISALNCDIWLWGQGKFKHTMKCPDNLDDVFNSGWFDFMFENNKHYYPQTFYLKNNNDYDMIFDVENLNNFVKYLNDVYNTNYTIQKINSTPRHFERKMFSDKHLEIIQNKYIEDYDNGWY